MNATSFIRSFNGDISGWNTSAVTNMANMFSNAGALNSTLSSWDTGASGLAAHAPQTAGHDTYFCPFAPFLHLRVPV